MSDEIESREVQLLLEEICCDLLRQIHVIEEGVKPETVKIEREKDLGFGDRFADIHVTRPDGRPYVAEIKIGHSSRNLVHQLRRKYEDIAEGGLDKAIIVTRQRLYADWAAIQDEIRNVFPQSMAVEFWDEQDVLDRIKTYWGVDIGGFSIGETAELRRRLDASKWSRAIGESNLSSGSREIGTLPATLLWHFSPWTLQRLSLEHGLDPGAILQYGRYHKVAVVIADLCGFSSYVKDTRDDDVVRHCLTAFYSLSRHAVLSNDGFLYQFVGDAVVGLFGLPRPFPGYTRNALRCAMALTDIGQSVSQQWQRNIDRLQSDGGLRVGIALGDITMIPLRPFSGTHIGFFGDTINMAARLGTAIHSRGVLVSNGFYIDLGVQEQTMFKQFEPVEAKNVGNIRCWALKDHTVLRDEIE